MDDDDNKDGFRGFFDRFGGFGFGGFDGFFRDMNQQMDELSRHMEEMFKDSGEIHIGLHPPEMSGKAPPLQEDPRDSMLKNADSPTTSTGHPQSQSPISAPTKPMSTMSPWSNRDGNISFFPASDSYVTGRMKSVQTVRKSDGSVERVEKTTENGRTCTTITRTDPEGNTKTNTTCDRPAIGDAGQGLVKPIKTDGQITGISQNPTLDTILGTNSNNPNHSKDDAGFFTKFFKKFGFNKPDS